MSRALDARVDPAGRPERSRRTVLGVPVDTVTWRQALDRIAGWAQMREARIVYTCNAHSIVTATRSDAMRDAIEHADLATPDGMPVAWFLRLLGVRRQERLAGPDLMWHYCGEAAARGESIFLFGSSDETLRRLAERLSTDFPGLIVAGMMAPPFGAWDARLDDEIVRRVEASGAQVLFVGLGCPKQELWMAEQRGRVHAVMVGVGAAFDFHAGTLRRAPLWMQKLALEWLYRLCQEPKRLARRYVVTNTLFVVGALRQIVRRS